MTWRVLYDAAMAEEPPSRVEWLIDRGRRRADASRRLVHGDLAASPLTWASVEDGWVWVLDGMKTLLETGEPLPDRRSTLGRPRSTDDADGRVAPRAGRSRRNNSIVGAARPDRPHAPTRTRSWSAAPTPRRTTGHRAARPRTGERGARRVHDRQGAARASAEPSSRCTTRDAACDAALERRPRRLRPRLRARGDGPRPARSSATRRGADAALAAARAVPIADPEDKTILDADLDAAALTLASRSGVTASDRLHSCPCRSPTDSDSQVVSVRQVSVAVPIPELADAIGGLHVVLRRHGRSRLRSAPRRRHAAARRRGDHRRRRSLDRRQRIAAPRRRPRVPAARPLGDEPDRRRDVRVGRPVHRPPDEGDTPPPRAGVIRLRVLSEARSSTCDGSRPEVLVGRTSPSCPAALPSPRRQSGCSVSPKWRAKSS